MSDARFEDGQDKPLRLMANDAEDLGVIAALIQDAVLPATEMTWRPSERRFALLLNRFRWEDRPAAEIGKRAYERVQSVLTFGDVTAVASQGIDAKDSDTVLSLLTVSFTQTDAPAGQVELTFAGDGALRLSVECLEVSLRDVTRPYRAPSGHMPSHED
ncbi:MAG: DUF2948 family protein [Mangrovicoccus sp.]|nr:DUF2948 family protein [Mangrovicoccus sp.]